MKRQKVSFLLTLSCILFQTLSVSLSANTGNDTVKPETARQRDARMAWWRGILSIPDKGIQVSRAYLPADKSGVSL